MRVCAGGERKNYELYPLDIRLYIRVFLYYITFTREYLNLFLCMMDRSDGIISIFQKKQALFSFYQILLRCLIA